MAGLISATRTRGSLTKVITDLEKKLDPVVYKEGELVKKDFEKVTANWGTEVTFRIVEGAGQGEVSVSVFTDNKIFGFVNTGTPPHTIRAKTAKGLFFLYPYAARTKPGSLTSGSSSAGPGAARKQEVRHPGTKPRGFHTLIAEKSRPRFYKKVQTLVASMTK
jgi:hypothetical protein